MTWTLVQTICTFVKTIVTVVPIILPTVPMVRPFVQIVRTSVPMPGPTGPMAKTAAPTVNARSAVTQTKRGVPGTSVGKGKPAAPGGRPTAQNAMNIGAFTATFPLADGTNFGPILPNRPLAVNAKPGACKDQGTTGHSCHSVAAGISACRRAGFLAGRFTGLSGPVFVWRTGKAPEGRPCPPRSFPPRAGPGTAPGLARAAAVGLGDTALFRPLRRADWSDRSFQPFSLSLTVWGPSAAGRRWGGPSRGPPKTGRGAKSLVLILFGWFRAASRLFRTLQNPCGVPIEEFWLSKIAPEYPARFLDSPKCLPGTSRAFWSLPEVSTVPGKVFGLSKIAARYR